MEKRGVILITDPDSVTGELFRSFLQKEGYNVMLTDRISECISNIQQRDVRVLVLDVEAPEMKWYESIPIIKGINPSLPIIITSSQNTPELEAKIRRQKVFYYHVKSFGVEELELAVRNAMERYEDIVE
jgi:DNA-binding NtrC family response regulator